MLLEHENERLHTRLKELIAENAKLSGKESAKQLELEIMKLQEQLALARQKMFGDSSEKRGAGGKADAGAGKRARNRSRQATDRVRNSNSPLSLGRTTCPRTPVSAPTAACRGL
jgi:hypothetical protein